MKSKQKPEKSTVGHWLLGDFKPLQTDILSHLEKIHRETQQSVVQLATPLSGFLSPRIYVIFDIKLAHEILQNSNGHYIKGHATHHIQKRLFYPEGIIFLESNKRWETLHHIFFHYAFNPTVFYSKYPSIFDENFRWLVARWKKNSIPVNLYNEITYFTMRTISHALFNYPISDQQLYAVTPAFKYLLDIIQEREVSLVNLPYWFPNKRYKQFKRCLAIFNQLLSDIMAYNHTEESLVTLLKQYRDPNTQKLLSLQEIRGHISTLFFAGHDTTANLITMLIYQLEKNPVYRDRIEQEFMVFKQRPLQLPLMDTLPNYTRFKNEVLRLFPSVPIYSRETALNVELGNYLIPKKSILIIATAVINKHPDYYKNPHTFNPDRTLLTNPDYLETEYKSFASFGIGPRRCLGQWFAQAEARSLITNLLHEQIIFDFTTDLSSNVGIKMLCTGLPSRDIWVIPKVPMNVLRPKKYNITDLKVRIEQIRNENSSGSIKTFRLARADKRPLLFTYYPGDYLNLFHQELTCLRHYTISSSPHESEHWVEITTKRLQHGRLTTQQHRAWCVGDELHIRAPIMDHPHTAFLIDSSQPLLLISGGVGITPMISISKYLIAKRHPRPIYFLHTCQHPNELAFKKLLDEFNRNPCFTLLTTFTQHGAKRRISTALLREWGIDRLMQPDVYLCGSTAMCDGLTTLLNTQFNIDKKTIHAISFAAMDWETFSCHSILIEEVARHNTLQDAWIIIEGIVYDITHYIPDHPGMEIITDYLGQDASDIFNRIPHSAAAKRLLSCDARIKIMGVCLNVTC